MPLTLAGTEVPNAGNVQYSTPDTTVAVDSLGRITARYTTFGQAAHVIAALTTQWFTIADTVYVQTVRSANLPGVQVYYASFDPTIATIDRAHGSVTAIGPGLVTFTVMALIDGVAHRDTVPYLFGPSHLVRIMTDVQPSAGGATPTLSFIHRRSRWGRGGL